MRGRPVTASSEQAPGSVPAGRMLPSRAGLFSSAGPGWVPGLGGRASVPRGAGSQVGFACSSTNGTLACPFSSRSRSQVFVPNVVFAGLKAHSAGKSAPTLTAPLPLPRARPRLVRPAGCHLGLPRMQRGGPPRVPRAGAPRTSYAQASDFPERHAAGGPPQQPRTPGALPPPPPPRPRPTACICRPSSPRLFSARSRGDDRLGP